MRSNAESFDLLVGIEPWPIPLNESFALDVWVRDAHAEELPKDLSLVVEGWMPDHEHGMSRVPVIEVLEPAHFAVRGMLFHMPGAWELRLDLSSGGISERAEYALELE